MAFPHVRLSFLAQGLTVGCLFIAILAASPTRGKADDADPQAKAIEEVKKLGGKVERDEKEAGKPVTIVNLGLSQVTDESMSLLKTFPKVQKLTLNGTKISDAGLQPLKELASLQKLYLVDTKITDAGLEALKGLASLRILSVVGTEITDAGLEHLKAMENLQELFVAGTKVTDEGVMKLKEALPKLKISK
jgi:Leucine-rich repeat (LRR) protein